MKIIEHEKFIELQPEEYMYLYNGEIISSGSVYLGINDRPENWWEITEEQKQEIENREEQSEN